MSVYHVTLRADRKQYPLLLSNGNLVLKKDLDDQRHEVQWQTHLQNQVIYLPWSLENSVAESIRP